MCAYTLRCDCVLGRSKPIYAAYCMLPLDLGKCITLHQCIGREDDDILLMLVSPQLPENLALIGFGRTQKGWDGFYLPRGFDIRSIKMDPKCTKRIRSLEERADALEGCVMWLCGCVLHCAFDSPIVAGAMNANDSLLTA